MSESATRGASTHPVAEISVRTPSGAFWAWADKRQEEALVNTGLAKRIYSSSGRRVRYLRLRPSGIAKVVSMVAQGSITFAGRYDRTEHLLRRCEAYR